MIFNANTIKRFGTTLILFTVYIVSESSDLLAETTASVADAAPKVSNELFTVNNLWMMIATFLVFIMHLGFATVESGLTRAKNTVNILFKNTFIVAIGIVTYAIMGFNLMYPGDEWIMGKFFGFAGFGIASPEGAAGLIDYADGNYTYWTDFLFQGMFAATAATIISGAVAERVKIWPFLFIITIYVAIVYPIAGSWKWGAGWLDEKGFYDFAGSTLVHSVGGWGALAGVILLGARIGKYGPNGKIKPIYGHNMPLATIGVFLLWLGWFGFNGGSVLSADPGLVSLVFVTTTIAAACGIIGAGIIANLVTKSLDLSMTLNGALAGLVGITAGADVVSPLSAAIIGVIAGGLVVFSVILLDKLKLDDPVGAISVHLTCGIWGTLAVGIFSADHTIMTQLTGILAIGAFSFLSAFALFYLVKVAVGIRVTRDEEIKGLDISEHGMEAYSGFQVFNND